MIVFTDTDPNGLYIERVTQVGQTAFIALVSWVRPNVLEGMPRAEPFIEVIPYSRVRSLRIFRGESDPQADKVVELLRGVPYMKSTEPRITPDWEDLDTPRHDPDT